MHDFKINKRTEQRDLCKWHVLKWHDAIRQLARHYSKTVDVGLDVIAAQILHHTHGSEKH